MLTTETLKLHVPHELRRGKLRSDEIASVNSGFALLDLMNKVVPIAGSKILDFGCGVKLVQALLERGIPQKKYVGLDVYREMIEYLKINCKDSRFELHVVNFHNAKYNPSGEKMTPSTRLPIADDTFDLITMFSVITHMIPEDALAILSIMKGYAHPETKLIFSAGITDKNAKFIDNKPDRPLLGARYNKKYLESIIIQSGWKIDSHRQPIQGVIRNHYICSLP